MAKISLFDVGIWAKFIIPSMVSAIIVLSIGLFIIYSSAKGICLETEYVPVRYEVGGLFSSEIEIETTEENRDTYAKRCTEYQSAEFWDVHGNIEKIVEGFG